MEGAGGEAEHCFGTLDSEVFESVEMYDVTGFEMICALLVFCYGGSVSSSSFLGQHKSEAREEGALSAGIPPVNGQKTLYFVLVVTLASRNELITVDGIYVDAMKDTTQPGLCNPEPYPLQQIPGNPYRPMCIRSIQRCLSSEQVRLCRLDEARPLDDFPEHKQHQIDRNPDVRGYEIIDGPGFEDIETVEEGDYGEEEEGEVCREGLEGRFKNKSIAVDALSFQCLMESDICHRNAHPGEEVGDGGQVLEPFEDDVGASGAGQVGQEGDGRGNDDAVNWDPPVSKLR